MKNIVVVLPTYNEKDNIIPILRAILKQQRKVLPYRLSVLVVDDNSPDGTSELVRVFAKNRTQVKLINGQKEGLGAAYIRGFKYAIEELRADIVFEMDADFSHDPNKIPLFIESIVKYGNDFVIGSRYIEGGSIPDDWPKTRKANSKWGNIFARYVTGIGDVKDCTSGYRAIRADLLKKINLNRLGVKGYAFQVKLLNEAINKNAVVSEIPIQFIDRTQGESKLRLNDVLEFVINSFVIRVQNSNIITYSLISLFFGSLLLLIPLIISGHLSLEEIIILFITLTAIGLSAQSIFTLIWMLYAWEDPENSENHKSPSIFSTPKNSFTALIPARHEEKVIKDTINAVSNINYPERLKEIIILCKSDDIKTIKKAQETITKLKKKNIKLITFDSLPINKPHALNIGLYRAKKNIIAVFDAEDEPHPDIYNVINSVIENENVDIIQSGVQLMNYRSHWFSAINVLEYFFWFKSGLHFFTKIGKVTPLGGNTVFIKKSLLEKIGGWDEKCLTEDADIGFRLTAAGAKTRVVYDEEHSTREETPSTIKEFIKQRTRWNQGFIQIFLKKDWRELSFRQKIIALYILLSPQLQALMFLYIPVALLIAFTTKTPIIVSMLSFIPLLLFILQLITNLVGIYEFTKDYRLKFSPFDVLRVLITFFPYQILLMFAAYRALYRSISKQTTWEKTLHLNAHRSRKLSPAFSPNYAKQD